MKRLIAAKKKTGTSHDVPFFNLSSTGMPTTSAATFPHDRWIVAFGDLTKRKV